MLGRLPQLLFANWKNKLVALFFALSIWFVAYQSENQRFIATLDVRIVPTDAESMVVMQTWVEDREGQRRDFRGEVTVEFTGPRKQVEILREKIRRDHVVHVPEGRDRMDFSVESFGVSRDRIHVADISPPWVGIEQEPVVKVVIPDIAGKVEIEPVRPGYDVRKRIVQPESGTAELLVPRSLEGRVSVQVAVPMPFDREELDGWFDLRLVTEEPDLARRTVRIWDPRTLDWVTPDVSPRVRVQVRLKANRASFERDTVLLTFRVPVTPQPVQIDLHDAPGGAIPVRFSGPNDRIDALQKAFREDPGLTISVPPPSGFDPARSKLYTFTEDQLEVPGFPEVQVEQHESRRQGLRSAWSYEIKVFPSEGDDSG